MYLSLSDASPPVSTLIWFNKELRQMHKGLLLTVLCLRFGCGEVNWTWRVLSHVFLLCQFAEEDFLLVSSLGIREAEVFGCLFSRKGQLSERCMGLLRVQGLSQSR